MNPGSSGNCRYTGSWFQARCDQLPLLGHTPASPPLNRCDDLNPSVRHGSIPMNTHMTHTLIEPASRPLSEGYAPRGAEIGTTSRFGRKREADPRPAARSFT